MTISITISKRLLVSAALVAVMLAGGTAWSIAQVGDVEYLYACVKGDSVRLVTQATDCKDQEVFVGVATETRILALEAQIAQLEADLEAESIARAAADTELEADLNVEAYKLEHFSRTDDEIFITGANLHVVNGNDTTGGTTNGLGNIIIGYNEEGLDPKDRTGSHMLVVGDYHSYSGFGGIVVGSSHRVSGAYSSVGGGSGNMAMGTGVSVSGGHENIATGQFTSVSGGLGNQPTGYAASICGGSENIASGNYSSVGGGHGLTADDEYEFQPE